ncbi:pancreatic lipase-related protein 2-like [Liolophura sinensis]|uniref:pancreatic lipase-related protein 2-like n=1 Tax=Liolophura sinensis TaxID=3198878 RepID=UPI0031593AB9
METALCTIAVLFTVLGHIDGWLFSFEYPTENVSDSVCYDRLGCFDNQPPFDEGHLPASPEEIGVVLYHYWADTPHNGHVIKREIPMPDFRLPENYNSSLPVTVVIHGYNEDMYSPHLLALVGELAFQGTVNVVAIDWGEGAHVLYDKSAANTRVVAAVVTVFLRRLFEDGFIGPESVHLIGYSLGAHAAGYVGQSIPDIGRITGLDPAAPLFQAIHTDVRLDSSDALFVDVIHTNGAPLFELGFGIHYPMGHADFYPNGGKRQPGCESAWDRLLSLITGSRSDLACSHRRAVELFTESIHSPCEFRSELCPYNSISHNYCTPCQGDDCVSMGYHVNRTLRGTFYLTTAVERPFCVE